MIRFNTGALYQEEGQVIRAEMIEGSDDGSGVGSVVFNDISRGIFAVIRKCPLTRQAVLHRYNYNEYDMCCTPEEIRLARSLDRSQLPVNDEEALPVSQRRGW